MMVTAQSHFTVIDNSVLDSSMNSTQGLLSFMTNASRQIKTYLGPDSNHQSQSIKQNKNRKQRLLSHLKTQSFTFPPDVLQTPLPRTNKEVAPVSPTSSLDSTCSSNEYQKQFTFRTSCLLKSRRQRGPKKMAPYNDVIVKRSRFYQSPIHKENGYFNRNNNACAFVNPSSDSDYENIIPSPTSDLEDLVDCILTEEDLAKLDVTNYFQAL